MALKRLKKSAASQHALPLLAEEGSVDVGLACCSEFPENPLCVRQENGLTVSFTTLMVA